MKTLRLLFPRWQGGITKDYYLSSQILNVIVPPVPGEICQEVPVDTDFDQDKDYVEGIQYYHALLKQNQAAEAILKETEPEAIITIGGDCSVSQKPFEYLLEKYGDSLGIIWLDAHTDTVAPGHSDRLHEMPLGDLLGQGQSLPLTASKAFISPEHVLFAGLIKEDVPAANQTEAEQKICRLSPEDLRQNPEAVRQWIHRENLQQIAVHWDLDVLSPADYRSILTARPYTVPADYDFAVGKMTLAEVGSLFEQIQNAARIVGLTLAEPVNWDALNLQKTLLHLNLFHDPGKNS